MGISFDSVLGVHEKALHLRAQRSEIIASNIANAYTPGYQARDIDFKSALSEAMGENRAAVASGANLALRASSHGTSINESGQRISSTNDVAASIKYRIPMQSALDGNTVETDREQAAFADNTVRYQATLQFLGGKFSSMKNAISGGR